MVQRLRGSEKKDEGGSGGFRSIVTCVPDFTHGFLVMERDFGEQNG